MRSLSKARLFEQNITSVTPEMLTQAEPEPEPAPVRQVATRGVAGKPGRWEGGDPPRSLDEVEAIDAKPETPWLTGQYVVVLAEPSVWVHWDGEEWAVGKA